MARKTAEYYLAKMMGRYPDASAYVNATRAELARAGELSLNDIGNQPFAEWRELLLKPAGSENIQADEKLNRAVEKTAAACNQLRAESVSTYVLFRHARQEIMADPDLSDKARREVLAELDALHEKEQQELFDKCTAELDKLAARLADPEPLPPPRPANDQEAIRFALERAERDRKVELAAERFGFELQEAAQPFARAAELVEIASRTQNKLDLEALDRAVERYAHSEAGENRLKTEPASVTGLRKVRDAIKYGLDPLTEEGRAERDRRRAMRPVLGLIGQRTQIAIGKRFVKSFNREPMNGFCSATGFPRPIPKRPDIIPLTEQERWIPPRT